MKRVETAETTDRKCEWSHDVQTARFSFRPPDSTDSPNFVAVADDDENNEKQQARRDDTTSTASTIVEPFNRESAARRSFSEKGPPNLRLDPNQFENYRRIVHQRQVSGKRDRRRRPLVHMFFFFALFAVCEHFFFMLSSNAACNFGCVPIFVSFSRFSARNRPS